MQRLYIFLLILAFALPGNAQAVRFSGQVVDPTGALVAGAEVTLIGRGNTTIASTKTGTDGAFSIDAAPGSYALEISAEGFDKVVQGISIGANNRPLTVTLSVAKITQEVNVEETPNSISLDPEDNQTALVLKEDDIQSLPDDEDELANYLTQLAGPRAAASGGVQFIIDGFLGGRLPPKDQIREIRINTNPFTTEYSRSGFGRIEIVTRPGTGRMRGNFNFNLRNDALNATQFNAPDKLPYSRQNFQANVSGPLVHNKLTLTMAAQRNDSFNTTIIKALTPDGLFNSSVTQPNLRENFNTRGQYAVSQNNTLNFNLEYASNSRSNQGIGQFSLPERASSSKGRQLGLQFRDTSVLSTHWVNETRFEFTRNQNTTKPLTQAVAINVLDAFSAGGAQNVSDTRNKSYLFGNTLIFNSKGFTLKTGVQLDYYRNRAYNANNFLGTYTFSSLDAYLAGRPTTFTMNQGDPLIFVSQLEAGAFVQTDIKLSNRFLISPGVRYQLQNHLKDYNNFDPRMSLSYQVNKTTVFRFGAGTFHQAFSIGNFLQLEQLNGLRQTQIVIQNPSFPDPFAGGTAQLVPPSVRVQSHNLVSTYTANISASLEKALKPGSTVSIAYDFIRGNHLYRSRNINAPLPGTFARPDPAQGNIWQLESSGLSSFSGLTLGYRTQLRGSTSLFVNYTFSSSYNDTDGPFSQPANNYDLHSEWGRSSDNQRHHFQAGINTRLPGNLYVNTQLRWNSGRPYTILTGLDNNGDTVVNDRPFGIARNSAVGPSFFDTSLNVSKTISLVRKERGSIQGEGFPGGDFPGGGFPGGDFPGGGFPGGGRGNGGFGGGGRGGGRGPAVGSFGGAGGGGRGGRGRGGNAGAGTTATFYVNVQNVLNHRNFNNPSGVLTSPFFGQSTTAQAPRMVELGVRFNF
jgi:hypothetical protein